jgi:hypothetical protein
VSYTMMDRGGPRVEPAVVDARCAGCDAKRSRPFRCVQGYIEMCSEVTIFDGEECESWQASIYDVRVCPRSPEAAEQERRP